MALLKLRCVTNWVCFVNGIIFLFLRVWVWISCWVKLLIRIVVIFILRQIYRAMYDFFGFFHLERQIFQLRGHPSYFELPMLLLKSVWEDIIFVLWLICLDREGRWVQVALRYQTWILKTIFYLLNCSLILEEMLNFLILSRTSPSAFQTCLRIVWVSSHDVSGWI